MNSNGGSIEAQISCAKAYYKAANLQKANELLDQIINRLTSSETPPISLIEYLLNLSKAYSDIGNNNKANEIMLNAKGQINVLLEDSEKIKPLVALAKHFIELEQFGAAITIFDIIDDKATADMEYRLNALRVYIEHALFERGNNLLNKVINDISKLNIGVQFSMLPLLFKVSYNSKDFNKSEMILAHLLALETTEYTHLILIAEFCIDLEKLDSAVKILTNLKEALAKEKSRDDECIVKICEINILLSKINEIPPEDALS